MNRRKFILRSAAAAGGGLALGFNLPFGLSAADAQTAAAAGAEINAWVVVKPNDTCVIRIARSEMGQGTVTGLAQLVVEELECDWKKVATEQITAGQNLARKRVWGEMSTGGSRGIRISQDYVRRGGAAARMMLLHAAVKACPVFGGKLVSYDESKLSGRPGVHRVVKVNDSAVAVVANTWWRAKTALEALPIVWDEGAGATQSSATIAARLEEGLT